VIANGGDAVSDQISDLIQRMDRVVRLLPDEWGKGNIDYIPKKRNLLTMRITELYHRYMSKVVLIIIVFMYYFTCISFAIRPSRRKSAIKLID